MRVTCFSRTTKGRIGSAARNIDEYEAVRVAVAMHVAAVRDEIHCHAARRQLNPSR
jgi:hypothetical protein